MDPELRALFYEKLQVMRNGKKIELTPHAVVVLTAIIEAIADRTNENVRMTSSTRDAQLKAIDTIPGALTTVSKAYKTWIIEGSMLLTFMPRFMADFCPPFQNPPS